MDRAFALRDELRQLAEELSKDIVVVDLPFGHGAANLAFPIGATVELDTDALRVTWIG